MSYIWSHLYNIHVLYCLTKVRLCRRWSACWACSCALHMISGIARALYIFVWTLQKFPLRRSFRRQQIPWMRFFSAGELEIAGTRWAWPFCQWVCELSDLVTASETACGWAFLWTFLRRSRFLPIHGVQKRLRSSSQKVGEDAEAGSTQGHLVTPKLDHCYTILLHD